MARTVTPRAGRVWIGNDDADLDVIARLNGKPSSPVPKPRYERIERPGRASIVQYVGHDPYELALPVIFDEWATKSSVEGRILGLERLAERQPGTLEPPIVRVRGQGVPHQGLRWRVEAIEPDDERTLHDRPGGDRVRFVATVRLVQHVTDELLKESLAAFRSRGKGLRNRSTRVKPGENSLYDVSRRVYGDPSRASDIARANPGTYLGMRLKVHRKLRLP